MTTFTMQDLTPEQQVAVNNHEEMHKMFNDMGTALIQANPTPQDAINNIAIPSAPEPQPSTTPAGTNVPTIESVIDAISSQLRLLATVISQSQAQGNSLNAEDQSLQECVKLVLQQGDWFEEMVKRHLEGMDVESIAESCAETLVEREVERYFDNRFDPSDHFDFNDAVQDAVSDQIDDVVRDRVMDSLEEVVAEKLSEASIKVEF